MAVIALTILISLLLVATFLVLFLHQRSKRGFGSVERESLLPLEEDGPPKPKS